MLGGLSIDAAGGVGDGGARAYEAELMARTRAEDVARAAELDERALRGGGTEEDMQETYRGSVAGLFRLARPCAAVHGAAHVGRGLLGLYRSAAAELPALEAALGRIAVPLGFVAGESSPMPAAQASLPTARAVPGAWVEVVDGAGHFPWFERPGCSPLGAGTARGFAAR